MNRSINSKLLRMKFVSCVLAPVITATSFCANIFASEPTKLQDSRIHNSQKSSSTFKDIAKKVAIYGGAALFVSGSLLYLCPKLQNAQVNAQVQEYLSDLSNPYVPVSGDDWFYRLGGNLNDIDRYKEQFKNLGNIEHMLDEKTKDNINKDAPRSNMTFIDSEGTPINVIACGQHGNLTNLGNLVHRISSIYLSEYDTEFVQGYDRYIHIILNKFLIDGKITLVSKGHNDIVGSTADISIDLDTEAKVYYIFSKIINMLYYCFGGPHGNLSPDELDKLSFANTDLLNKSTGAPAQSLWVNSWFTCGIDSLNLSNQMILWDNLIMNNNVVVYNNFNGETVFDVVMARKMMDSALYRLWARFICARFMSDTCISNSAMKKYYENPDNFKAAIRDIIE